MKTLIVTGGSLDPEFALALLEKEKFSYLIAVDKGLEFYDQYRILPDCVVGDFDSARPGLKEKYVNDCRVEVKAFPAEKNETDTEIAIHVAIERGSKQVVLLGATGTRADHVLGNIQLLGQLMKAGIEGRILDRYNSIRMTDRGITLKKAEQYGDYVSLIPFTDQVTGITLKGFKYPLKDYTLVSYIARCVSNEIQEDTAEILFEKGILLVIETKDALQV